MSRGDCFQEPVRIFRYGRSPRFFNPLQNVPFTRLRSCPSRGLTKSFIKAGGQDDNSFATLVCFCCGIRSMPRIAVFSEDLHPISDASGLMNSEPSKKSYSRRLQMLYRPQCVSQVMLAIVLVVSVTCTGCGGTADGRVPVSGEVKFVGQPLDRGSIEFHPLEPTGVMTGGMIADGKFEIPAEQGAKPGKYQVRVFASGETLAVDPSEPPGPQTDTQVSAERVAAKFNVNSELEVEISSTGNKDLIFEVSGP